MVCYKDTSKKLKSVEDRHQRQARAAYRDDYHRDSRTREDNHKSERHYREDSRRPDRHEHRHEPTRNAGTTLQDLSTLIRKLNSTGPTDQSQRQGADQGYRPGTLRKRDHSNYTCNNCGRRGHIAKNCRCPTVPNIQA